MSARNRQLATYAADRSKKNPAKALHRPNHTLAIGARRDFVRRTAVGVLEAGDRRELAEGVVAEVDALLGDAGAAVARLIEARRATERVVGPGVEEVIRPCHAGRKAGPIAGGVVRTGQDYPRHAGC